MIKYKFVLYYIVLFFFVAVILLSVFSCRREYEGEFLGPNVCPTTKFQYYQEFDVDATNVNFASGATLTISAIYNEVLPWEVVITGTQSGATKKYSGKNDTVSIAWRGNADAGSIFFANEDCQVSFKLACSETLLKTVTITKNTFTNFGVLLSNFDGNGVTNFSFPPYGYFINIPASGKISSPVPPSPQGGNYYRLVGDSGDSLVWGYGGFWGAYSLTSLGITDAKKVYFNAFVNCNGVPNSNITFTFREAGISKNMVVNIDWDGWKMVSFPLSDAGVTNAAQVTQMDIYLGAAMVKGTKGEFDLDFVIVTPNTPFYP